MKSGIYLQIYAEDYDTIRIMLWANYLDFYVEGNLRKFSY